MYHIFGAFGSLLYITSAINFFYSNGLECFHYIQATQNCPKETLVRLCQRWETP